MTDNALAAAPVGLELLPEPEPIRLLQADGTLLERADLPLDLSADDLRALHRHMVMTRRLDREALVLQRQGQLAVYASCLGQEGAQVGSAFALQPQDWVFPSYREHGVARVRGLDPVRLLHHSRGTWLADHDPYEHHFALQSIPIATHALHATGFAMGAKLDGKSIVTAAYFGDGATSEGDAHEAFNFASVYQASTVFFIQNNHWAISVPVSRQMHAPTIAHRAIGYGMPGVRVDGNDVLASYAVMRQAVARARRGDGPTLIEAVTYRMEGHSTSDDPTKYRTPGELEKWAEADPLARMEAFLRHAGLWDDDFFAQVEVEVQAIADRIRAEIYEAPHGNPLELFDHVYVRPTAELRRQREQMRAEIESRENTA
jgi:2-oxoisovalerate dehydrogenase E1 component alpha subunit